MRGREVIERVFDAPIEVIWELWTTPEGRASWFGPKGFEVEVTALELEAGGAFAYVMRAVDPAMARRMEEAGRPATFEVAATFTEVEHHRRLAWTAPAGPTDTLTTSVTFTVGPDGVHMELVLEASNPQWVGGAAGGWRSSLSRLEGKLAG